MFCVKCQKEIPYCTCPDIEERLKELLKNPTTAIAALQNIEARRIVQGDDIILDQITSTELDAVVIEGKMPIIAIYQNSIEYPGKLAARIWTTSAEGPWPTNYVVIRDTLKELRESLPANMIGFTRDPQDDPSLVGTLM